MTTRLFLSALLVLCAVGAGAQTPSQPVDSATEVERKLQVALRTAPPFVIQGETGDWRGLSVQAFEATAERLGWNYDYVPTDLEAALQGTRDGRFDVAVGAFTVTAEREQTLDFSHPFHTSGLGIAVHAEPSNGWLTLLGRFFSLDFLKVALSLGTLLLGFGLLVWLFERRANPDEFGGRSSDGIGAGFWWAAVTMTTVGYGDKSPRTLGGRIVALVWMFAAIIVISSFTAAITSSLTISRLGSNIESVDDLERVRTATLADSSSAAWLADRDLRTQTFDSLEAALAAVEAGRVSALVYDAPLLQHLLRRGDYGNVRLLPETVERQDYALVVPEGSELREPMNRALLSVISGDLWSDTVRRYLGD